MVVLSSSVIERFYSKPQKKVTEESKKYLDFYERVVVGLFV